MWRQVLPRTWRRFSSLSLRNDSVISLRRQLLPHQPLSLRGISSIHRPADWYSLFSPASLSRVTRWNASHFSTDANANGKVQAESSAQAAPPKRRVADDLKEYKDRVATGKTASFDARLIPADDAHVFPRIKTTSLSTKRIVIHDQALTNSVTLVLVAFRSFADQQLQSWKRVFVAELPPQAVQWYDVTINESFGARALSGFIQRLQRGRTDPSLHDYHVAFNSKAREPLESLLPSRNRMFGYVLLLDRQARVRFRASGMASEEGLGAFLSCAKQLLVEDSL